MKWITPLTKLEPSPLNLPLPTVQESQLQLQRGVCAEEITMLILYFRFPIKIATTNDWHVLQYQVYELTRACQPITEDYRAVFAHVG